MVISHLYWKQMEMTKELIEEQLKSLKEALEKNYDEKTSAKIAELEKAYNLKITEEVGSAVEKALAALPIEKRENPVITMGMDRESLIKGFNEDVVKKAISIANSPVLVPPQYASVFMQSPFDYGVVDADAYQMNLISNSLLIPKYNATTAVAAYWQGELGASTASNVSISSVNIAGQRLDVQVNLTKEMVELAQYPVIDIFQREVFKGQRLKRDKAGITDSTPFTSIFADPGTLSYTLSGSASANVSKMTYQDLVNIKNSIDPFFWDTNLKWYFDRTIMGVIEGMVDNNNRPIIQNALEAGKPPTILNIPYKVMSDGVLAGTSVTSAGTKYFFLGNMKNLWHGTNGSMEILYDPFTSRSTGQVTFWFNTYEAFGVAQPKSFVFCKIQ